MKKTTSITLGFVMSAAILWGCGDQGRCVDAEGIVVSDDNCRDDDDGSSGSRTHRWYYGGHGYQKGERATSGSYTSRGGFGRFASFHSSGGS